MKQRGLGYDSIPDRISDVIVDHIPKRNIVVQSADPDHDTNSRSSMRSTRLRCDLPSSSTSPSMSMISSPYLPLSWIDAGSWDTLMGHYEMMQPRDAGGPERYRADVTRKLADYGDLCQICALAWSGMWAFLW
ncbi:hypothetical protein C8F04DRAFT_1183074 [Mycena alexandri]|uniref:Uncharacterized protein n=1 Tax=Mycena alexandri TaxID=1745969 RepID=A0AAD6SVD8_9AGAR|nr:hypothetical protein C8F04DRAFT_1183074 [Mycena alexandri]